jgi:hypothetical protein
MRQTSASRNESLRAWQEKAQRIKGAADRPDWLRGYEAQLAYLRTDLPQDIEKLRTQRREIDLGIHKCIAAIRDAYKELFKAVQDLISSSVVIKEGFRLTFESSIIERNLEGDLFDKYVSANVAGKRRQIIMVTLSPNIAVVCDAKQIIHAHIKRAAGNAVIYTMGAIEYPDNNRFLVDVLEGTRPAFDNRDAKYFVQ